MCRSLASFKVGVELSTIAPLGAFANLTQLTYLQLSYKGTAAYFQEILTLPSMRSVVFGFQDNVVEVEGPLLLQSTCLTSLIMDGALHGVSTSVGPY